MLVKERMSPNPITVRPDLPVPEAQVIMKREKIHHLPVVDRDGKLVGIVAEKDLLYASPSPATTLSVYEIASLLSKLAVEKVMSKKPVTVTEDVPLEEAARIMADRNIGGLPVMRCSTLVGIITESDLFRVFIELFGARQKGVRISLVVPNQRGELAKVTDAITKAGGNILALGTFLAEDTTQGRLTVKVEGLSKEKVLEALRPLAVRIEDVRES